MSPPADGRLESLHRIDAAPSGSDLNWNLQTSVFSVVSPCSQKYRWWADNTAIASSKVFFGIGESVPSSVTLHILILLHFINGIACNALWNFGLKGSYMELIRKLNRLRDLGNQPKTPLNTVNLRVPQTPGKGH